MVSTGREKQRCVPQMRLWLRCEGLASLWNNISNFSNANTNVDTPSITDAEIHAWIDGAVAVAA